MNARIEIVAGRLEALDVEAIVNAANTRLLPGAGVDGAIRAAAGPKLTQMTNAMAPIEEGGVALTPGFDARPRWIIHTAAPVWFASGDEAEKDARLRACYRNALALAEERALSSIAFPCIGTGIYGWPKERACAVAVAATQEALRDAAKLERVVFCCFLAEDLKLYEAALSVS